MVISKKMFKPQAVKKTTSAPSIQPDKIPEVPDLIIKLGHDLRAPVSRAIRMNTRNRMKSIRDFLTEQIEYFDNNMI